MTELRKYEIDTPAGPVVVQLSDAEAKERGLTKPAAAKTSASKTAPAKRSAAQKRSEVASKSFGGGAKRKA